MASPEHRPLPRGTVLEGADLRHVIYVLFQWHGSLTVAEIVAGVDALGFELRSARGAKQVSDMLGREVRRGRVRRVARATYALVPGGVSRTTLWRARVRVADGRALAPVGPVGVREKWNRPGGVREGWNRPKSEGPVGGVGAPDLWGQDTDLLLRFIAQRTFAPTEPEPAAGPAQAPR